jgi:hypothetical protein
MKLMKISFAGLMFLALAACGSSESEDKKNELTDALNELNEELESADSDWRTISTNSYFDVDIPTKMVISTELNDEASVQYEYVEEVGGTVKELYMIVIMETKEEIESYELDMEFDALSYGDLSVANLEGGLDTYNVLTKEPVIETVNGLDCAKYEMAGTLGTIGVYYKLGVFEGENAFYQVLTWTLEDQKSEFKGDMEKIINSFKEK